MKRNAFILTLVAVMAACTEHKAAPASRAAPQASELTTVLAQMDKAGRGFTSAQADFKWEQFTAALPNDIDVQTGKIFFRRKGKDHEVAIQVLTPHPKRAWIKNNHATMYNPAIPNEVTERKIDNNDAQSIMNAFVPFGIKGDDLLRDYEVTFGGWETVDKIRTARLELVARKAKVGQLFSKVILWIDLERDVAVQQQRFESRDYQLAHYSNILLGARIPDEVFTIKK